MQSMVRWATVLTLALSASACAYGIVDEPDDDDDDATGGVHDFSGSPVDPGGSFNMSPGDGDGSSAGACYSGGTCNPMQSNCGSGEACDATETQGFACFPPPNNVLVGGECDSIEGPFCASGATCVSGTCRAYCCTSADCSLTTCQTAGTAGSITLRVCLP